MQYTATSYNNFINYRYGFQGQEKDDEIKGEGNSVNYTYRMHDTRLGRFFAIDPLFSHYTDNSPYAFSQNIVIAGVELEGLETHLTFWQHGAVPEGGEGKYWHRKAKKHSAIITKTTQEDCVETVEMHSGGGILGVLHQATKNEGELSSVTIFSHSTAISIFADPGVGLFTHEKYLTEGARNGMTYEEYFTIDRDPGAAATLDDLVQAIDEGKISFNDKAIVIFSGCNVNKHTPGISLSKTLTQKTGIWTIAANSKVNNGTANGQYYFNYRNEQGEVVSIGIGKTPDLAKASSDIMQFLKDNNIVLPEGVISGIKKSTTEGSDTGTGSTGTTTTVIETEGN